MRSRDVCGVIGTPDRFHGNRKRANDTDEIYESAPAILGVIFKDVGHLRMNREDWNRFHWTLFPFPRVRSFGIVFLAWNSDARRKGITVLSDQAREMTDLNTSLFPHWRSETISLMRIGPSKKCADLEGKDLAHLRLVPDSPLGTTKSWAEWYGSAFAAPTATFPPFLGLAPHAFRAD